MTSTDGADTPEHPTDDNAGDGAPVSDDVETLDPAAAELVALAERVRETEARLRAVSKAYADQKTEMPAFRQRIEAQAEVRLVRKEAEVVRTFFEPVQNLERSIEAAADLPDGFRDGIRMVHSQFMEALARLGLEPVPGVGARFDPNFHEALGVLPVDDPSQDGVIQEVYQGGFQVAGKAIQAARVVIGQYVGEAAGEA